MNDAGILLYVGAILCAAVGLASASTVWLIAHKKIGFDRGFFSALSACALGVALCLSIRPAIHRVFDDEFSFISQAFNILLHGNAGVVLKGSLIHPQVLAPWSYTCKFPGYACLEAAILFLTRNFEPSFFILNLVLSTLLIAVVYRMAWLWTHSQKAAWWAAVCLACLPVRITYSMSAASDISGLLLFSLFILYLFEYGRTPSKLILSAAFSCGLYSFCLRTFFGIFFILGLAAALVIYRRKGLIDQARMECVAWASLCLMLPLVLLLPSTMHFYGQQGTFTMSAMIRNIGINLSYLFNVKQNTPVTTLAAIAGIRLVCNEKDRTSVRFLCAWFLAGFLAISAFPPGQIVYPGDGYTDRYFLFLALPYVLLAGRGMADVAAKRWNSAGMALVLILLIANAFYASHKLDIQAKGSRYLKKISIFKKMAGGIPSGAYVIEKTAALVAAETPLNAVQTDRFLQGDRPGEVVYLKGIPVATDTRKTVLVEEILGTGYRCQPLTSSPFREGRVSALPFFCRQR